MDMKVKIPSNPAPSLTKEKYLQESSAAQLNKLNFLWKEKT